MNGYAIKGQDRTFGSSPTGYGYYHDYRTDLSLV
jgi:hypothetical protein